MSPNGELWEKYNEGNSYLLVADVARGDGADNSVFHIIKLESMEVVAEYQGKITPDIFSRTITFPLKIPLLCPPITPLYFSQLVVLLLM